MVLIAHRRRRSLLGRRFAWTGLGPFASGISTLVVSLLGITLLAGAASPPPPAPPSSGQAGSDEPAAEECQTSDRETAGRSVPAEKVTPPNARALILLERSDAGLPIVGLDIAGQVYRVELAHTAASRSKGMGGRRTFPAGTAMLFVHPDDLGRRYWMKGCLVPIDIAFLDRQGRITAMHRMPPPPPRGARESQAAYEARLPRYPSRRGARYALELPSGDLDRLGLRVGQVLPLPHAPLQATARFTTFPPRR